MTTRGGAAATAALVVEEVVVRAGAHLPGREEVVVEEEVAQVAAAAVAAAAAAGCSRSATLSSLRPRARSPRLPSKTMAVRLALPRRPQRRFRPIERGDCTVHLSASLYMHCSVIRSTDLQIGSAGTRVVRHAVRPRGVRVAKLAGRVGCGVCQIAMCFIGILTARVACVVSV